MLYLGSKSPRRNELLKEIVKDFIVIHKEVDESFDFSQNPHEVPIYLAGKKFESIIDDLSDDDVLITADTVVIKDNSILNKPENYEEASYMIKLLMGRHHYVTTGVIIGTKYKKIKFSDTTKVFMESMSEEEINYYINKYHPFDKAGSYGIQDWIGMTKISKIEGSYSNVIGLPTQKLYKVLKENFNIIP